MARTLLPTDTHLLQFRAVVSCDEDPCRQCRGPARREVVEHPDGSFPTAETARDHGRGMANNVYGSSTHSVSVEFAAAPVWQPVPAGH